MSILKRITGFMINSFLFIFLLMTAVFMTISIFFLGLMTRVYLWFFEPKFVPADIHVEQKYYPYTREEVVIFNT